MSDHHKAKGLIGRAMKRVEDPAILQGKGQYVADIQLPGMVFASFVRSPYGHAKVGEIDLSGALSQEGVVAAFTREDLSGMPAMPLLVPSPLLKPAAQYVLSDGTVRFTGEAVAVVVGENQYVAEDGIQAVTVGYTPLPAVSDAKKGLEAGAQILHESIGTNLGAHIKQYIGETAPVMESAPHVVTKKIYIGRGSAHPMETRGVAAEYSAGQLTVWSSTQCPHNLKRALVTCLGLPENKVRVITPDVGGGFGTKVICYPEEIMIPWLAVKLGRPVKWIEDRKEHFLTAAHEREQYLEGKLAVDNEGKILALEVEFWADQGAYVPWGIIVPYLTSTTIPGQYKIPAMKIDGYVVYTNKAPIAPYRGAGRPQGVTIMEGLMDLAAEKLNIDASEIRFRNFIQADEYPYKVGLIYRDGSPLTYDSGDYPLTLQKALDAVDYTTFRARQKEALANGRYIGVGMGTYVEGTGMGPFEGATLRVEGSGRVTIYTGAPAQGQGHKTVWSQIAADQLGIPMDIIDVIEGDTDKIAYGIGTFASRVAALGGSAVLLASQEVRAQVVQVAAVLLDAAPEEIVLENGNIFVAGNKEKSMTFEKLARMANNHAPGSTQLGKFPGLESTQYFKPAQATYASGAHTVVVEVDPDTGGVKILDYAISHDCGNAINPLLVDGQVQGGLGHGISGALFEELIYDKNGQLLTGSYMDFLLPGTFDVPDAQIFHIDTPTPLNPLGAKGAGEGGTIPCLAAVGAAVEDALKPFGVRINEYPVSPRRVYTAVKGEKHGSHAVVN